MNKYGFTVERKFRCRELGTMEMGKGVANSYLFNIGICWEDLSTKDKNQCRFLTKKIHKLPLYSHRHAGALPLKELKQIVRDFYMEVKQESQSCIAYKGGTYERDLLKELAIPAINLETFDCPKASTLFNDAVWVETCNQHIGERAYEHCPRAEVVVFGEWLTQVLAANTDNHKKV